MVGMGSELGWICSGGGCRFQCGGEFAMVFWIWVLLLWFWLSFVGGDGFRW